MKLVTSESMREIDRMSIETMGIPGIQLMEKAGIGTVRFIERRIPLSRSSRVPVFCGKGNNGGDGFVIARELRRLKVDASVYLLGRRDGVSGDARRAMESLGPELVTEIAEDEPSDELAEAMDRSDFIIDALFGTGFQGAPRDASGKLIEMMNASTQPVLSVDVPSGLNASTGEIQGACVKATWTCTMALPKRGFYLHPGKGLVGLLHVVDIGIPDEAVEAVGVDENVLTDPEAARLLPDRPPDGHKGTFGKVVVVAGSVGYTGAAALSSMSALRTGAGLVYLCVPESLNDILETKLTEVITRPMPETPSRTLSRDALSPITEMLQDADAAVIGPGLSRDQETEGLVRALMQRVDVPCVLDADGLNALSQGLLSSRGGRAPLVLTPHPGEMSRLIGSSVTEVQKDRPEVARCVAAATRAAVLLKGAPSVVAGTDGRSYLNPNGSSGLASAGTGDVLTGVIAALLCRGMDAVDAAALGAFIHGRAGDIAAEAMGEAGMVAGDVMLSVPQALMEIEEARL